MKFKISNIKISKGNSKDTGKPWTLFNFRNALDGLDYSAFAQAGHTDKFENGYEFEAETTEKPNPKGGMYRNIQWPKQERGQSHQINNAQLDRIEQKLDRVLLALTPKVLIKSGSNIDPKFGVETSAMPYADSPPPSDNDEPHF